MELAKLYKGMLVSFRAEPDGRGTEGIGVLSRLTKVRGMWSIDVVKIHDAKTSVTFVQRLPISITPINTSDIAGIKYCKELEDAKPWIGKPILVLKFGEDFNEDLKVPQMVELKGAGIRRSDTSGTKNLILHFDHPSKSSLGAWAYAKNCRDLNWNSPKNPLKEESLRTERAIDEQISSKALLDTIDNDEDAGEFTLRPVEFKHADTNQEWIRGIFIKRDTSGTLGNHWTVKREDNRFAIGFRCPSHHVRLLPEAAKDFPIGTLVRGGSITGMIVTVAEWYKNHPCGSLPSYALPIKSMSGHYHRVGVNHIERDTNSRYHENEYLEPSSEDRQKFPIGATMWFGKHEVEIVTAARYHHNMCNELLVGRIPFQFNDSYLEGAYDSAKPDQLKLEPPTPKKTRLERENKNKLYGECLFCGAHTSEWHTIDCLKKAGKYHPPRVSTAPTQEQVKAMKRAKAIEDLYQSGQPTPTEAAKNERGKAYGWGS